MCFNILWARNGLSINIAMVSILRVDISVELNGTPVQGPIMALHLTRTW